MQHPDEGMIHAWLDGELSPSDAEQIEAHTRECAECAQKVAEARGLIAASTRILTALDSVPSGVVPSSATSERRVRRWYDRTDIRAAAVFLFFAGASLVALRVGRNPKSSSVQTMAKMESAPVTASVALDSGASPPAEARQNALQAKPDERRIAAAPPAVSPKTAQPSATNAFGSTRAMDEITRSKVADAPVAQSAAGALMSKVGGVVRSDAGAVGGRVEGKVVDSAGRAVAAADITVPGTSLRAFSDRDGKFVIDSVPPGQRQILARRIGYVAQEVPVVVKEESAAAANITMAPVSSQLNQVVVSGVADKAEVHVPGAAIAALKKDTSATTQREIYEVSPGVKVTLVDSLINVPAEKDLMARREAKAMSAPSPAPAAVMNAATADTRINTISWTDGNHHYTLSGPLTTKELEAIKPRIMKLRR